MSVIFGNLCSAAAILLIVMGMWTEGGIAFVQVPERLPECPVRFIRGTLVAQDGAISVSYTHLTLPTTSRV